MGNVCVCVCARGQVEESSRQVPVSSRALRLQPEADVSNFVTFKCQGSDRLEGAAALLLRFNNLQ